MSVVLSLSALCACALVPVSGQISVPMAQYEAGRSNANLRETILRPGNVNTAQFGKLFEREVDDSVYAEPLILAGLDLGDGPRNILIVATMNNTVYAFDADRKERKKAYWVRHLGTPTDSGAYTGPVHLGILSTPVFDAITNTIYAVSKNKTGKESTTSVHALDAITGRPKFNSPQLLSYPFRDGTTLTDVPEALQRPGLLVTDGVLVIATASILPGEKQEGFVQTFDAADLRRRLASFQVTPTGLKGGIWQAGRGVAADGKGNIYVVTAGGSYDGQTNWGSTYLKLEAKTLRILDWFTPANFDYLYHNNVDPSGGGVLLIPGSSLVLGGGKEGVVYLMDGEKMGHLETESGPPLQRFPAAKGCGVQGPCAGAAQSLGTAFWSRGTPVQTAGVFYVWDRNDNLRAYLFDGKSLGLAPASTGAKAIATGGPTVSADGANLDSGIVWAVTVSGEFDQALIPATLRAFAAADVSKEIYNSDTNFKRDQLGAFTKFATPVVANGKVYVPTHSGWVSVYGLLGK